MAKIAISLPNEVLEAVEKERTTAGISRSEYFRRTVEEHLSREREREREKEDVARYIQGYLDDPETPDELAWVRSKNQYAFDDESWEDEFNK